MSPCSLYIDLVIWYCEIMIVAINDHYIETRKWGLYRGRGGGGGGGLIKERKYSIYTMDDPPSPPPHITQQHLVFRNKMTCCHDIFFHRTLGTPDERLWPGVSELPDYKSSFPKWPVQNLLQVIPALSQSGAELLQVRNKTAKTETKE